MNELKARFDTAAKAVKQLEADPGNDAKLALYALYKQALEGDVQGKRPGFTDPVGRAKYDAWAGVRGMSAEQAMQKYVELVRSLGA
jgi:acyl-CoA-binding protein